jgi:cytochrome c peroxidase
MRRIVITTWVPLVTLALLATACGDGSPTSPDGSAVTSIASSAAMATLGRAIFEDENLSINRNQSCASCHADAWGGTGPESATNAAGAVYEGSIPGRFGNRKPPTSTYATLSPILYMDRAGLWIGGNFWDGRATGEKLGNPAADQAQGPFLNPAEQALPDNACVVYRVANASYAGLYVQEWGNNITTINFPAGTDALCGSEGNVLPLSPGDRAKVDMEYDHIALSIAAFEDSPEVNKFSSKFDNWKNGAAKLTMEEKKGQALFNGRANCARCHLNKGKNALFTDFTFDNLGVPRNPLNPALMADPTFVDEGLGGFLKRAGYDPGVYMPELGKQKVPTLRNVDKRPGPFAVKAYAHNGYFKSLKSIVHFYNTRDVLPACPNPLTLESDALAQGCWPAPEVAVNVNSDELGDLGLTGEEEDAIVAYLKTLSDDY